MPKKPIRPIRTNADYRAALEDIERYFEDEPKRGTPEAARFERLALVLETYENKKWPIGNRLALRPVAASSEKD
jgi:HTH-type transcriptional regulator/antitoxin HigA